MVARRWGRGSLAAGAVVLGAGVGLVAACGDGFEPAAPTGGGGSTGGAGGQGGADGGSQAGGEGGQGGGPACAPPATESWYEGEPATLDVGICHGGERTCQADGTWGGCDGQQLPETENCYLLGDEDCDGVGCADPLWSLERGDGAPQFAHAVATDSAGNVAVVGQFEGTLDLGGTPLTSVGTEANGFVASLDADGNHRWSVAFGDGALQAATAVAVDGSDHLWVTGVTVGTIVCGTKTLTPLSAVEGFVMRFDGASGLCLDGWVISYLGATGTKQPNGIAIGSNDTVWLAGQYTGYWNCTVQPCSDSDGWGAFVRAYSFVGSVVEFRRYDGSGDQMATAIAMKGGSNPVFGGSFTEAISFGTGHNLTAHPTGTTNAFLVELGIGVPEWERNLTDSTSTVSQSVWGVAVDDQDSVIAVGSFAGGIGFTPSQTATASGTADAFAVKYDADDAYQWGLHLGAAGGLATGYHVAVAQDRSVAITGWYEGAIDFGTGELAAVGDRDAFLLELGAGGAVRWTKTFGVLDSTVTGRGVAVGRADQVLFVGTADVALDLGGGVLPYGGDLDLFAAAYEH